MSENGDIYTVSKKFTLTPAVTAVTNLTSGCPVNIYYEGKVLVFECLMLRVSNHFY